MKTLYESILDSTKSGSYVIRNKISEWWQKYYRDRGDIDKGNFRVEKMGNTFVIVMDEFERQPSQGSVTIKQDAFDSMPKELGGIYYTAYESRGNGKLKACEIVLYQIQGRRIDLSHWNMAMGEAPLSVLDLHIKIAFCQNCKIKGLPNYGEVFNCYLMHGKGNTLEGIKSPKCNISIHEDDEKIDSVTKCECKELLISAKNFEYVYYPYPYCKSTGWYLDSNLQDAFEKLITDNKFESVRYVSDNAHDTPYVAQNNWTIGPVNKKIRERNGNSNWPKYKLNKIR